MTFFPPLLSIRAFDKLTIKHVIYMEKVPFLYTERACVLFSGFEIHLGFFLYGMKCSYYFGPEGVTWISLLLLILGSV